MALSVEEIISHFDYTVDKTTIPWGEKMHVGKVRDTYRIHGKRVLITTDRQSAFDRMLTCVPFKGQVLNRIAAFWFEKTKHIIPNHCIALPDANTLVVQDLDIFPVEFVVRAYMTGSTDTSVWVNYKNGVRNFCGHELPDGLKKDRPLPKIIVTPTTKPEEGHDESISRQQIIDRGLMSQDDFDLVEKKALELFSFGQQWCDSHGLILVDTKYEFGKDGEGNIVLADEIHTPDSSRFWEKDSYQELIDAGKDPKCFDKDVIRRWYSQQCNPYEDEILPSAPKELVADLSIAYQKAYEVLTGEEFIPDVSLDPNKRISDNLASFFGK